jgi:hypothetical protein
MAIHYLSYKEIDHHKWDTCISNSPDKLIYAYSWFLNIVCPDWGALVLNDYEAVMPLTSRQKFGIHYLFQPPFCAELGIFSIKSSTHSVADEMLANIPKKFRYVDICLNRNNHLIDNHFFRLRKNYVLPLFRSYEDLVGDYSLNHKRNIKKAMASDLCWVTDIPISDALQMARTTLKYIAPISDSDAQIFYSLFMHAAGRNKVICAGVRDQNNTLLSVAVFFYSDSAWYYLLAGSTQEGRAKGAAHYLIDQFIFQHAGQNDSLDFEGSDVPTLAFFYKGFGAKDLCYPSLVINRLPFWLRWLKD